MKRFLLPSLALLLSPLAQADYSATVVAYSDTCKTQFFVKLTSNHLHISPRHYSCIDRVGGGDSFEATGNEIKLEVNGQTAYLNGQPVGGVNDGIIKISHLGAGAEDSFSFALYPLPSPGQSGTLWENARRADQGSLYFQGTATR